jgi:hypothetical protein
MSTMKISDKEKIALVMAFVTTLREAGKDARRGNIAYFKVACDEHKRAATALLTAFLGRPPTENELLSLAGA